jgi:hypothetical protein
MPPSRNEGSGSACLPTRMNLSDLASSSTRFCGPHESARRADHADRLLGATIDPVVATAIMAEGETAGRRKRAPRDPLECPGPVEFDGTGRIRSLRPESLSPALASRLEAAIIKPLADTRSDAPLEAPRPPRSILTVAMHLLRSDVSLDARALAHDARRLFLSSSLSHESVAALLDTGIRRLGANERLLGRFKELAGEIKKQTTMPQLADNLYGRTFESLLVDDLVREPPAAVLNAAHRLGSGVLGTLARFDELDRSLVVAGLAEALRADPRPWHGLCPSLTEFLDRPSMDTLSSCVARASSGIEAVKVAFVAASMLKSTLTLKLRATPQWLRDSDRYYRETIFPEKPQEVSNLRGGKPGGLEAGEPGIWLHYQPNATTWKISGTGGRNWTHSAVVSPESTSSFVDSALSRGQTVVTGPSGQTSLLTSFGQHLAQANPDFPLPDHHLLSLMSLVFDGGHSTEEVLYTLHRVSGRPLDGPLQGYEAIATLTSSSVDSQALYERLENALDKTLDYHGTYVGET